MKVREILTPNPFQMEEYRLWRLPLHQDANRRSMIRGDYENKTAEYIRSYLKCGMGFVDIGAHIGYFSLIATKQVIPDGKVWAFEPHPETFQYLFKNIQFNYLSDSIIPINKAVSEKAGVATFFCHRKAGRSSLHFRGNALEYETSKVKLISLDDYFKQTNWPRVDLVKMDVEGSEIKAIKGMYELSAKNEQMKMIIEYNPKMLLSARSSPEDLIFSLMEAGFHSIRSMEDENLRMDTLSEMEYTTSVLNKHAKQAGGHFNLLCEK